MQQKKYQNSVVEVDLSALKHNISLLKRCLQPDIMQMAVVKADAYGHGSVPVTQALREEVAWFAVNTVDEGIELRENGIDNPILVFGVPEPSTAGAYASHNLTATVSSLKHFDILPPGSDYHINIDTGMGRLGIMASQLTELKKKIESSAGLHCTGIYSHFATADEPSNARVLQQLERFRSARAEFPDHWVTHLANTAATAWYPDAHFDMVRNGIGIYGYAPGETAISGLRPALSWKTRLVQVKPVEKGDTASYGAAWAAPQKGYVGVIPVGYEDGIRRNLSGRLRVRIGDSFYPVAGTVTMNYCMIYLGEQSKQEGEEVYLLDGEELTARKWAQALQTIPYEILTGISSKIARNYKE